MISLRKMIERDLKPQVKQQVKYQIQAQKNSNIVKLACVKEENDFCIYEEKNGEYTCSLLSYTLTDKDIENNMYTMMGYLIKDENKQIIATLDFMFCTQNDKKTKEMQGSFKIVLSNNKNEKKVFNEYPVYIGDDQVPHVLTDVLTVVLDDMGKI